ncbi:MAG: SpoIIE family protein phosphatase [Solirubrobacteraceae bacterium]
MGPPLTELILDHAPAAVIAMDDGGLVRYWNPSAERMFGIPRDLAVGQALVDLIVPERLRDAHRAGLARFLEGGDAPLLDRSVELAALRADGSEVPITMTVSAVREQDRWTFHAFVQDESERHASAREHDRLVAELQRALHGSQRRFDAIVGSLTDPVTIRDRSDRIVYANGAALEALGFQSQDELAATPPDKILAGYIVRGEDGREVTMDEIPSVRLLRGQRSEPLLVSSVDRATGAQRWSVLKSAPVLDQDGAVEATIMLVEDVTERQRAQRHSAFLAEASAVLASSLDYEQTLRNVAQLAVPGIVDWCALDLIDADGDRLQVAVAHVNPDRLALAEQLRHYEPARPDPERGLGRVLRTGERELYPEISDEMLAEGAVDEHHLELLREVGFRSVAVVPMRAGERILGAMTLVSAESGRVLDEFDLELAEHVAARAAVAIENARLYSERTTIAQTLQASLMPDQLPEIAGYELAAAYTPAVQGSWVGGDFYDVWDVGDAWFLTIGDVTGKGVKAAALTSLVRHTLRAASEYEASPAALLATVDRILARRRPTSICTALCLRVDADGAVLAVGGHPLPLLVGDGEVVPVGEHGPLLGGFDSARWQDHPVALEPGGALVAYTDGVTDAVGEDGTRYGTGRLYDTLRRRPDASATDIVNGVVSAINEFQPSAHADDIAALVIRRRPRAAHAEAAPLVSAAPLRAPDRSPNGGVR